MSLLGAPSPPAGRVARARILRPHATQRFRLRVYWGRARAGGCKRAPSSAMMTSHMSRSSVGWSSGLGTTRATSSSSARVGDECPEPEELCPDEAFWKPNMSSTSLGGTSLALRRQKTSEGWAGGVARRRSSVGWCGLHREENKFVDPRPDSCLPNHRGKTRGIETAASSGEAGGMRGVAGGRGGQDATACVTRGRRGPLRPDARACHPQADRCKTGFGVIKRLAPHLEAEASGSMSRSWQTSAVVCKASPACVNFSGAFISDALLWRLQSDILSSEWPAALGVVGTRTLL